MLAAGFSSSNHFLYRIPNDRQLELFVLIRLVHAVDPGAKTSDPNNPPRQMNQKGHWYVYDRDNECDEYKGDPESRSEHGTCYAKSDRLCGMESHKRPLIQQQKNQSCNPQKDIAEQPSNVFFNASRERIPAFHRA